MNLAQLQHSAPNKNINKIVFNIFDAKKLKFNSKYYCNVQIKKNFKEFFKKMKFEFLNITFIKYFDFSN